MILSNLFLLVATAGFSFALPNLLKTGIQRMQVLEEETKMNGFDDHAFFKFLRASFKSPSTGSAPLVGSFKWKDCGSSSELIHINGLSLTPDPLKIPGNVGVKFDVDFKETVDAPLKADLKLEKHEGPIWLTIPCIDGIGSCTYDDLCDKLKTAVCPKEFDDHHIPCKCPFPQGNYSLPTSTFSLDIRDIPDGEYYAKAELSSQSKQVICIELYFNIA